MIITRGFGESEDIVTEYVPVPVCSPEMTAHEWGEVQVQAEPVEEE